MTPGRSSPVRDDDIDAINALTSLKSTSPSVTGGSPNLAPASSMSVPALPPVPASVLVTGGPGNEPPLRPVYARTGKDKFPVKLMEILSNDEYSDCVIWMPHGRSFLFTHPEKFTRDVLPKYFRGCKFSSFTRKLYRWGFRQISKGPDAESFFHKHFRRDKKTLCQMITSGREIRDGCPELHCGISVASLLRHEQMELREEMMESRSRQMREAVFARQQLARMGGGMAGVGGVPLPLPMLPPMMFDEGRDYKAQPRGHLCAAAPLPVPLGRSLGAPTLPPMPLPVQSSLQGMMVGGAGVAGGGVPPPSELGRIDMEERMIALRNQKLAEAKFLDDRAKELHGRFDVEPSAFPGGTVPNVATDPSGLRMLAQPRQQQQQQEQLVKLPDESTNRLGAMQKQEQLLKPPDESANRLDAMQRQIQAQIQKQKDEIKSRQSSLQPQKDQHEEQQKILPKPLLSPVTKTKQPSSLSSPFPPKDVDGMADFLHSVGGRTADALEAAFDRPGNASAADDTDPSSSVVASGVIRRAIDALRTTY